MASLHHQWSSVDLMSMFWGSCSYDQVLCWWSFSMLKMTRSLLLQPWFPFCFLLEDWRRVSAMWRMFAPLFVPLCALIVLWSSSSSFSVLVFLMCGWMWFFGSCDANRTLLLFLTFLTAEDETEITMSQSKGNGSVFVAQRIVNPCEVLAFLLPHWSRKSCILFVWRFSDPSPVCEAGFCSFLLTPSVFCCSDKEESLEVNSKLS